MINKSMKRPKNTLKKAALNDLGTVVFTLICLLYQPTLRLHNGLKQLDKAQLQILMS